MCFFKAKNFQGQLPIQSVSIFGLNPLVARQISQKHLSSVAGIKRIC